MARQAATLTILFADIAEGARLYAALGDSTARGVVADCLGLLSEQTTRNQGTVIKTIGSEIMCTFVSAEDGIKAAMSMQDAVTNGGLCGRNNDTPSELSVSIGMHHGPVIVEDGDVFGDAVNVAARMAGVAKGGQILTTLDTVDALPHSYRTDTRHVDRIPVKGKAEDIDLFEVIWQNEDVTRMTTGMPRKEVHSARLKLAYHSAVANLNQDMPPFVLGRGKKADMVISDTMASREHAKIECHRGKFILTDMSTNGTYVLTDEGASYLRREEIVLSGRGKITLGRQLSESSEVVSYLCESE